MSLPPWPLAWSLNPRKTVEYLLNAHHAEGGPKARFFLRFGFTQEAPDHLAYELLSHARPETYAGQAISRFGDMKYLFEGPIRAPDGRMPRIRTVWRIDVNRTAHFVTAVPMTA
ncbi:DUF6883 domain-containing protein [uncultured Methylobacterium sp.]|uniref:DUF6883 domain-containing protein n=1 Tax=uncultured Methylobacterium sp. TaxID=157278 RepID=UPI0035CBFB2C